MNRSKLALAATAAIGALALSAPAAQAGPLVDSAASCDSQELSHPFAPWLDPAAYVMVPGGDFESGAAGWTLTGGASVVNGNESHNVGGSGDSHSLSLPAGSSATSPAMCVGIEHPTLRGFLRNTGSSLSSMQIEVLFEDLDGNVHSADIATHGAGSSWNPSSPMLIGANLIDLLSNGDTAVAFRFSPQGWGGSWRIDDFYVDPYRRS